MFHLVLQNVPSLCHALVVLGQHEVLHPGHHGVLQEHADLHNEKF